MKAQGNVVFKSIEKRDGGVFKNSQGQDIKYDEAYVVRFDEDVDGKVIEKKVKFPASNTSLYTKLVALKTYDKINIICDVNIQNSACKLTLIDFTPVK